MAEYIDREAFKKSVEEHYCLPCKEVGKDYNGCRCRACWVDDMLDEVDCFQSAADVAPVRHGRWIDKGEYAGCITWVSIEPFPTPNIVRQDLQVLLEEVSFVDRIIFGRMNYNTEVTAYTQHKQFFNDRAAEVIAFCNERGIGHHIKDGTITE